MAFDAHKNFAASLVATAPSPASSGTSLIVTGGDGVNFPAVSFNATVWPAGARPTKANSEIVRVTNIAVDTFTITRIQESTSARTIVIGDNISANITAKTLTDVETLTALLAAQNTFANTSGQIMSGPLDLSAVTAGQVSFPAAQNASAGANVLDDYEEGTWTPVLGGSGGTSGQTYSIQVGSYIKIGQLVWATFAITLTVKGTITTNAQIQGFPFAFANIANLSPIGAVSFSNMATNWLSLITFGVSNTTAAFLEGTQAAVATVLLLTTTDIANNTTLSGTLVYRATA